MVLRCAILPPTCYEAAMARMKAKAGARRAIRCYLCGETLDVSARTMSTTCPKCNHAIKVEDVIIKSYMPVNDLKTCGKIKITKRGRVAARVIKSGDGIICEGTIEAEIETDGHVELGPKSTWKGKSLRCRSIDIAVGAKMMGEVKIPWTRSEGEL